jgi:serine/threonine protein kinase
MDAYLVGECIGRGQYSRVHSGTHKASGTPVALKLVTKPGSQPSEDQPSLVALRAEVQCQRHLRHSNILRLLACFETDQEVVFVSELCQGDLLQRLKNYGRFSEPALKEVATQLVDALHYLHQNNIIHRDLKLQVRSEVFLI